MEFFIDKAGGKEKQEFVFHSQGTILGTEGMKILVEKGIKVNEYTKFVFLGPAVNKSEVVKLAMELGIIEDNFDKQLVFNANPRDPVANILSDGRTGTFTQGLKDLSTGNFKDHDLDSYKWWQNWHPNFDYESSRKVKNQEEDDERAA